MAIRVNLTSNLTGVTRRANELVRLGQYAFANQVHADSNIYAPKLSMDLVNQSTIAIDGKSIIWNVPYARKQYYGYGFKFSTPGTGPKWDSKALAIHGADWLRITKAAMK